MSLLGAFHRGPRRRGMAGIIGPVLRPADPDYAAEIAAFNPTVNRRPGIVVGAQCEDDVVAAVVGAGADKLPVGVKGAGHGTTADPTAPVLISTRRLDAVAVDPRARTARVGAGATWAQVVAAAAPHGLTALVPSSTRVGVAGYTLGGGLGLLGRRYGFAADHLRRLRLVTADGRPHEIDADRAPELHWALRGAGRSGFGVVTELEFELFPLARLYGGGIVWAGAAAADVLHAWRQWAPTLPDDAGTSVALLRVPRDARLAGATAQARRWCTCVSPRPTSTPSPATRCSPRCARSPRRCTTTSASCPSPTSTPCTAMPVTRRRSTRAGWCCASCPPRPSTRCSTPRT